MGIDRERAKELTGIIKGLDLKIQVQIEPVICVEY